MVYIIHLLTLALLSPGISVGKDVLILSLLLFAFSTSPLGGSKNYDFFADSDPASCHGYNFSFLYKSGILSMTPILFYVFFFFFLFLSFSILLGFRGCFFENS